MADCRETVNKIIRASSERQALPFKWSDLKGCSEMFPGVPSTEHLGVERVGAVWGWRSSVSWLDAVWNDTSSHGGMGHVALCPHCVPVEDIFCCLQSYSSILHNFPPAEICWKIIYLLIYFLIFNTAFILK